MSRAPNEPLPEALSIGSVRLFIHISLFYGKSTNFLVCDLFFSSPLISNLFTEKGTLPLYPQYEGGGEFSISHLLQMPTAVGKVYFGQSVGVLVVVRSLSRLVSRVTVRVEVPESKKILFETPAQSRPTLRPNESQSIFATYDAHQLGLFRFLCTVTYVDSADGETRTSRNNLEFAVSNPILVKTRIQQFEEISYLQAQLSNMTKGPLYLTKLQLEPHPPYVPLSNTNALSEVAIPPVDHLEGLAHITRLLNETCLSPSCAQARQAHCASAARPPSPQAGAAGSPPTSTPPTPSPPPPPHGPEAGAPATVERDPHDEGALGQGALGDVVSPALRDASCVLRPGEVHQCIFQLCTNSPLDLQSATPLGRLEIAWYSAYGEPGHLQTNPLSKKVCHGAPDIHAQPGSCISLLLPWRVLPRTRTQIMADTLKPVTATLASLPSTAVLERPFTAVVVVTNHTTRPMRLKLVGRVEEMEGIITQGRVSRYMGVVEGNSVVATSPPIEFVGILPGIQRILGLAVVDLLTGARYEVLAARPPAPHAPPGAAPPPPPPPVAAQVLVVQPDEALAPPVPQAAPATVPPSLPPNQ
ncbi:putative trafficking protein particle complex subunit 13 [Paratrimastix pyriformis]|uniref:Trafficking protein particle complex subunit 13 n=1 Tax=Paratrimastix pyriformis TaxID=342808 RepID=A0ABQ8UNB9_9EUKA|nr:putative trafficking protein particle complex subunit 13 [Paratrimastix pyriformis]